MPNVYVVSHSQDRLAHQQFEAEAAAHPEAIALVHDEIALSYGELNRRANQVTHQLLGLGIKPNDRVAICAERSLAMVVGLLGILKAGAAYVPLDPTYPPERLAYMLDDSAPAALVTQAAIQKALPGLNAVASKISTLLLDTRKTSNGIDELTYPLLAQLYDHNPDPVTLKLTPQHLAYVIYTSGSTGTPKGVCVSHQNLCNYIPSLSAALNFTSKECYLHTASFAFSSSVRQLLLPLCHGARIVIASAAQILDCHALAELSRRHKVTVVDLTPSYYRNFLHEIEITGGTASSLFDQDVAGTILSASEPLPWSLASKLLSSQREMSRMVNMYGQTETCGIVSIFPVKIAPSYRSGIVPVGSPIANTKIYLLDTDLQSVPIGVDGEIYIGGADIASGYLNKPELTAMHFIRNPFSTAPDARLYKTGDRGRWLPDGNVEYLGRNDHQVKIRGFRIEPGEIEARLTEHPALRDAVVIAREDVPGDKHLVAYVVPTLDDTVDPTKLIGILRAHLSACLPEYMVPATFVRLNAFPLTPNGKLDRNALPATEGDTYARRPYEPPQGEIEQTLATLWEELLGVENVSRHDNFFELGGHSLLVVRLMGRLRRINLEADISSIFASPTLAVLALTIFETVENRL